MNKGYVILKELLASEDEVYYDTDPCAFLSKEDAIDYLIDQGYKESFEDENWHEFQKHSGEDLDFAIIKPIEIY